MNGRNARNAHHRILLLPEIGARRVVVIGTTTSIKCKIPNTTRNPINALSMCVSVCSHNASHQRQSSRDAGILSDCMCLLEGIVSLLAVFIVPTAGPLAYLILVLMPI